MSDIKQRCQLNNCNRAASARCFCCDKNVCARHFTEHIDTVKAQIDPLANEINAMVEKIQGLTIEQFSEKPLVELKQWQSDMHQLIDEIFLNKSKEIEDLIELNKDKFDENKKQQSEIIMKIQDEVKQLAEDGDAAFEQIQLLKNQLATVDTNLTSFRSNFLLINAKVSNEDLVTVSSNLNKPPPSQTFPFGSMITSTASLFGTTTAAPTTFGFGTTTAAPNTFGFGTPTAISTTPLFGATTAAPTISVFGTTTAAQTTFGFCTTTTVPNTFGFGTTTAAPNTSLFGAKPAILTTPLFSTTTAAPTTSVFCTTTAMSITPRFGTMTVAPTTSGFGMTTAASTTFGFGTTTAAPTTSGFVPTTAAPTTSGFGTMTITPTSFSGQGTSLFAPATNVLSFGTFPSTSGFPVPTVRKKK